MPPFLVKPCTLEDSPGAARNNILAFWPDPSWRAMWQVKSRDYVIEQNIIRYPKFLLADRKHRRHEIAVDEATGEVVGYTRWVLPDIADTDLDGVWASARVVDVSKEVEEDADANAKKADWEYDHSFDGPVQRVAAVRKSLFEGKGYLLLDVLAIAEDYWRQGIGTKLVESGIQVAKRAGLDISLQARKNGIPFYKKHGFEVLDEVIPEDSKMNGESSFFLLRKFEKA